MAIEIVVQPLLPTITISDNPSSVIQDLSNYVVIPALISTSGQLEENTSSQIAALSGVSVIDGYVSNVTDSYSSSSSSSSRTDLTGVSARFYLDTYNNTNVFGSSFRGRRFRGTATDPSGVIRNDVLLQLVGDGYSESGNMENATASLVFFAAENFHSGKHGTYTRLRTTPTGTATQIERILITSEGNVGIGNSNPFYVLDVSGSGNFSSNLYINNFPVSTINYVNFISGELYAQIQGGGGSGVTFLNSLTNSINLISSTDSFLFNNTGNNINIWNKEQNSEIYRNISGQITGVKYNADFSRIFRSPSDKITGIYYNNYFKKILYDVDENITGVNVIYY